MTKCEPSFASWASPALPVLEDGRKRLDISDGSLEALKWLALVCMTIDHVNKYLFAEKLPGAFELGRLAMPLFGFVLAYNLARPGALQSGAIFRTIKRLSLYGLAATPFFIGLSGLALGWWPLNIMFMLLVATCTIYLAGKKGAFWSMAAAATFSVGGAFVEFWWFGLAFCIAAWWYCKTLSKCALLAWLLAAASLYAVNRNLWAMAAMPVILATPLLQLKLPRFRHLFYAYYPVHLAALLISIVLGIRV